MIEERQAVASERALLVGLYARQDPLGPDLKLDELESLVEAAGGSVVGRAFQRHSRPDRPIDAGTFIGRGKAEHVASLVEAHEADVVVFDNELSPAQIRELERIFKRRVIDRSELILDIFASRARTRESKLQVELAQLEYTAPRLRGMWTHLERQAGTGGAGGLGTRGPGEKQIELDRRIVGQRIFRLKRELAEIHDRRIREVESRTGRHFCVGLVGYTNAGKSTLLNAVTNAGTYAADKLFATLDTKTRQWRPAPGIEVMLSDTVGFVRDLPHFLVASFRATLEEALHADLVIHVIDVSHPQALEQVATVEAVLSELGCDTSQAVAALNKADLADEESDLEVLRARLGNSVVISAKTGEGLDALADRVVADYRRVCASLDVDVPAGEGRIQAWLRGNAEIRTESYVEERWHAEVMVMRSRLGKLRELAAKNDSIIVREIEASAS